MDGPMDGRFSYTNAINAFKNDDFPTCFAIFTKAVRTKGLTVQATDIPSYRDAKAANRL